MDIMQVLQDICKSPEAHDKGTNTALLSLTPFLYLVLDFLLSSHPCPQTTCAGTLCPPCWALPEHSDDTATLTSRCCLSCSHDRWPPWCPPPMMVTRRIDAPSTTSAPSCRALCSPCARETPCGAKAPPYLVFHSR